MRYLRPYLLGVWCALFGLLLPTLVQAQQNAHISSAKASRQGHVLTVSFIVEGAFTPKMEEAVQSGIPQTFTYQFEVYRVVTAWPDQRIYNWTIKRTIRYDTLKKIYTVELGSDAKPKQTDDLAVAKTWMTSFTDFPVAVVPALDPSTDYYVRVKAELDPVQWPLHLNKILFLANLWSFETPWMRVDLPIKAWNETTTPTP